MTEPSATSRVTPVDRHIAELEADEWRLYALCRGLDPELFYLERGERSVEAKSVCNECPVRTACLEHAIATGEAYGIWGGMSERARRRIRRQRHRNLTEQAAA